MQQSLKQNIAFFDEIDEQRLNKVIQACGLECDLEEFDEGINKICTEHGTNLSGGQRSRINLARALY